MNNFMNLMQFFKGVKNPQQMIMQMLGNNTNPMAKQMLQMVQNGDREGIEKFARNVVKEQGKDFDTELKNFKDKFGL